MQIIAVKPIIGLEIHRKVTGKPFECEDTLALKYIEKGLAKPDNAPAQPRQSFTKDVVSKIPDESKTKRRRKK